MKSIFSILLVLCVMSSCDTIDQFLDKDSSNQDNISMNSNDISLSTVIKDTTVHDEYISASDSILPLIYEKYKKIGYVLKGKLRLINEKFEVYKSIPINEISKLEILEKSTRLQYIDRKLSDNCNRAYYLKVKYKDSNYTVFGQDVYEIVDKQSFKIKNNLNESLEINVINPLKIGCSDEDGLSTCPEYYYILVENKSTKVLSLVEFPENGREYIQGNFKYGLLFNDDQVGESVYKTSLKNDTIELFVKYMAQESSGKFKYKLFNQANKWKSIISDTENYNAEDYMEKYDNIK